MTNEQPTKQKRRRRARPVPKWIKEQEDLDALARRRCLMILAVLSGQRPVSDVIEEAQISRPMYYQLEQRALSAMLRALAPGGGSEPAADGASKRVAELEAKCSKLEQDKRRSEHLLHLTRKLMGKGPVKTGTRGRKRKNTEVTSDPQEPSMLEKTSAGER